MTDCIVVGFSGDLDTMAALPSLAIAHAASIVTLSLDLGDGRDLGEIRDRALASGAVRAHVLDAREEFARRFVLPALRAGALREGHDPMSAALARPLMAEKLAEVAAIEQATGIVDRSRLDATLWGRQGGSYMLTRTPEDAPATPARVEIAFVEGVPVAVNGVPMGVVELFESLAIIAGHHAVGRFEMSGTRSEAPAPLVLQAALDALSGVNASGSASTSGGRGTAGTGEVTGFVQITLSRGTLTAAVAVHDSVVPGA
jgi:argininosuccinate synthase